MVALFDGLVIEDDRFFIPDYYLRYDPGPGTYVSSFPNLYLTDLNYDVPVELILTMILWLLETVLMLGSMIFLLMSYCPGPAFTIGF